jgi:hypothetical protein
MAKYRQGIYEVKNTQKYVGTSKPRYRSGWEMTFMLFLDSNDHILNWASEPVRIPYRNPLTNKMTNYVPDFIVTYRSPDNTVRGELIEIKPKKQSLIDSKQSQYDRAMVAINYAKWDAASKWCKQQGLSFRVITEDQIYHQGNKRRNK